ITTLGGAAAALQAAFARGADLARGAGHGTSTAVHRVVLRVDAAAVALGEVGRTGHGAGAGGADLTRVALLAAGAAVVRVDVGHGAGVAAGRGAWAAGVAGAARAGRAAGTRGRVAAAAPGPSKDG